MGARIFGQDHIPIRERGVVIFVLLVNKRALRKGGRGLRTVRKCLHEIRERLNDPGDILHLDVTPAEFISGFGTQLRRKLGGAQFRVNWRGPGVILLFVERLRFQQLGLIGAFCRRVRGQELVHLRRQPRSIGVVNVNEPLVTRVFRLFTIWIFRDDLTINRFRFGCVSELSLAVGREQHDFRASFFRNLLLHFFVIGEQLRVLTRLIL